MCCRLRFEQRVQRGRAAQDALRVAGVRRPGTVRRHENVRIGDRHLELVSGFAAYSSNLCSLIKPVQQIQR